MKSVTVESIAHISLPLVTGLFFFLINLPFSGPVFPADEGGYLAFSATISGAQIDAASSYFAGYSILIAPAFLIADDPKTIYFLVKVINCLLWGCTTAALLALSSRLFPARPTMDRFAVIAAVMAYPAWATMAGYAFPTSAFVLFVSISALALLYVYERGRGWWIVLSAPLGFLYWIHPTAVPTILSALAVTFALALHRRESALWLLLSLLVISMIIIYERAFSPLLQQTMQLSDIPPKLHYPGLRETITGMLAPERYGELFSRFSGTISYAGLVTGGMAFVPALVLFNNHKRNKHNRSPLSSHNLMAAFLTLSLIGSGALSAILMTVIDGSRLDHWMYGRYSEGVIAPLLMLGLLQHTRKLSSISLSLTAVFTLLVIVGLPGQTTAFSKINGLGLWQSHVFPFDPTKDDPRYTVLSWAAAFFVLWSPLLILRDIRIVAVLFVALYSYTIFLQREYHRDQTKNYVSQRYQMVEIARATNPGMDCVTFDQKAWDRFDPFLVYAFYFLPDTFLRAFAQNWPRVCAGPLISQSTQVDEIVDGAKPLFVHKLDRLILWGVPTGRVAGLKRVDCPPLYCVEFIPPGRIPTQVGVLSVEGVTTSGRPGYLAFGPYVQLKPGKYHFMMHLDVSEGSEGISVDIVEDRGRVVHAQFDYSAHRLQPPGDFEIDEEVVIDRYADDIEVRIKVGGGSSLVLRSYSLTFTERLD